MTVYAQLVLATIGHYSLTLKVPHDGSPAYLVGRHYTPYFNPPDIGPLEPLPVKEILQSNLLHKLTRDRIPPFPKKGEGYRMGWVEMGLDGTTADFYCLTQ